MSIDVMKQALEALETCGESETYDGDMECYYSEDKVDAAITALRLAIEQAEKQEPVAWEPIELHVLHSHIAGVLFDFMGWLTTRRERLTLSGADEAGPAVEAIKEFAKMRGLRLEDAQVEHWQAILTAPPQRQPLTDEQLEQVFPAIATYHEANKTLYRSIARAIERAHGIGGGE